jgi:hypothetical protein
MPVPPYAAGRGSDEAPTQALPRPAPQSPVVPAPTPPRPATAPRTRKARLRLQRLDPWSVMKLSFLLSIAVGIIIFIAVAVVWSVLDAVGIFSTVGQTISDVTGSANKGGFDLQSYLSLSRVLGFTTLVALVDVVLWTALATLGAFCYNLTASVVGGLEVTLAEDD